MSRTTEKIIKSATDFYNDLKKDANGRYRSWEYCYKNFYDSRKNKKIDLDYLCLQLAFYLASWGMYRGSSFLLQKDYKVHLPVVQEILKKDYNVLCGIKCVDLKKEENMHLLMTLSKLISSYYKEIRESVVTNVKNDVSTTLVTKVLMGTLGCVPAYDRYFIDGVKHENVASGLFTKNSIMDLITFFESNSVDLEPISQTMTIDGLPYPQMKMLDMGFWQIGYDLDPSNKGKANH